VRQGQRAIDAATSAVKRHGACNHAHLGLSLFSSLASATARNRSGVLISQDIEKNSSLWTKPKSARFAQLETEAVQRPHFAPWSVSVVRVVPPNPFETTRKFGGVGVAVGVCDGKMADGESAQ
jgi:hypothetical protein